MNPRAGGVDFSWGKPAAQALRDAGGIEFVIGYVSPLRADGPNGKDLSAVQVAAYRAAGLQVGLVFESGAQRALGGSVAGRADGATARARAQAIGYPRECVIFWAVDFDAPAELLPTLHAYGVGFGEGWGGVNHGPYGSAAVIDGLGGSFPWRWQTAAWSRGRVSSMATLLQHAGTWRIGGADCDRNELLWSGTVPFLGAAPAPSAPPPLPPAVPFDVAGFRLSYGQYSERLPSLRRWANQRYPGYKCTPLTEGDTATYGPQLRAFVAEFGRHIDVPNDGRDIGPKIAAGLAREGWRG